MTALKNLTLFNVILQEFIKVSKLILKNAKQYAKNICETICDFFYSGDCTGVSNGSCNREFRNHINELNTCTFKKTALHTRFEIHIVVKKNCKVTCGNTFEEKMRAQGNEFSKRRLKNPI